MAFQWLTLAQDLVGRLQLAVLALQRLQLLGHLAGHASTRTPTHFGLLDPLIQCLRRTAYLRGNRQDRRPAALMLPGIVQNQANGTRAHFGGILARRFAHDDPSYSGVGASGKPGAVQKPLKSTPLQAKPSRCSVRVALSLRWISGNVTV
jgi:hypothetical protein